MSNNSIQFIYTGAVQTYKIPYDGYYIVECWGAQGGNNGGLGGYSKGTIKLTKDQTIYVYVGGQGSVGGGWNGGGNGGYLASIYRQGYGGGGASDVRKSALLADRLIVAAGGGGTGGGNMSLKGGDGGGLAGLRGVSSSEGGGFYGGNPGTQTAGGAKVCWDDSQGGSFGQGGQGGSYAGGSSNLGGGGGGGGYYGGGGGSYYNVSNAAYSGSGGGGGSSYIGTASEGITTTGVKSGNGEISITYIDTCVLYKDNKYYITEPRYFNPTTNEFTPVALTDIIYRLQNGDAIKSILDIDKPFTLVYTDSNNNTVSSTYVPSNILNFNEYKLCTVSVKDLVNMDITYTPSTKGLSKTNIKVKDEYTPSIYKRSPYDSNFYLSITATDKSKIDYFLDHGRANSYKNCSILNTETTDENFYANFKLDDPGSLLSSITLCGKDNSKYTRLRYPSVEVFDNLKGKKFLRFSDNQSKVIVNRLSKESLDYTINTLDKF